MTFDFVLALSGTVIVVGTVLPFWRVGLWWVRIFDFPCAQLALLGIGLAAIWLYRYLTGNDVLFSVGVMPFLVGSLIVQGYRIYPYTVFASKESLPSNTDDPERTFSILAANVLMKNRNDTQLLTLINKYNPDLILLTEANHWWERAMKSLETQYTFTIKKPLENTYGMLLYSRISLIDTEMKFLVEDDVPSFHTTLRITSGETVDFYGLHPRPPRIAQDVHERDAELLIVGRSIAQRLRPAIVAGDLNDVAWSHSTRLFLRRSGLVDPRIGRGFFNTFPAQLPFFRFPMDHIFHSEHMRLQRLQVLKSFGSDHYPIFAALSFEDSSPPPANAKKPVRREAQEKITNGLEHAQNEAADTSHFGTDTTITNA